MENTNFSNILKGLAYINAFTFRFHEAEFWQQLLHYCCDQKTQLDVINILRMATAQELFPDERVIAQNSINKLSIEHPEIFEAIKSEISALNKLI